MSLLITGAYGFIASRLTHALLGKNRKDLVLVDKPDYGSSRDCAKGLESLPCIDREKLFEELPKLKDITAVVHLGACTDTGNHD